MKTLLTDIELDVQELRFLIDSISRDPDSVLREVAKRNILQMKGRLDILLLELDKKRLIETEPIEEISNVQAETTPAETVNDRIEDSENESVPLIDPVSLLTEERMETEESLNENTFEVQLVVEPTEALPEEIINPIPILAERIKPAGDLRRSISLNDSFRFSRELFEGDSELMNRILQQIGEMTSLNTALVFLESKIKVDKENEAFIDFSELLKKYFN